MRLSWVVLESILGSKFIKRHWLYKCFVNIMFLKKITLGRASSAELCWIWSPNRLQHGTQIGAEWSQNGIQKRSKNQIGLGSLLRQGTAGECSISHLGRSRRGGRGRHKSLPLGVWIGFIEICYYLPSTRPEALASSFSLG